MVRVNCDYIPAWPIVYYVKKSYTILHVLWPLITWKEHKNGNKVFALFYFLFRLAYKVSETQFVDFLWPIIHLEYNGRGFRFGIRPLFWVISTDRSFKLTILGIINIMSKDDGNDVWVVIFPFIWYRYKSGKAFFTLAPILWVTSSDSHFRLFLFPFLMYSGSKSGFWVNVAGLLHLSIRDGGERFYLHILPALVVRVKGSLVHVNVMVLIHFRQKDSKYLFVIAPIFFMFGDGGDHFTLIFLPVTVYRKSNGSRLFILAFLFYRYAESGGKYTFTLLLPVFFRRCRSSSHFTNIAILFNHSRELHSNTTVLFPFLWIRKKNDESFYFHLWPAFGFKVSQKNQGFNIYLLYPAIIYKNKQNGTVQQCYFLFPLGYYYKDREDNKFRLQLLPFFYYSNMRGATKGFVLLYFWYSSHGGSKTRNVESSSPTPSPIDHDGTMVDRPPTKFPVSDSSNKSLIVRGLFPLFLLGIQNRNDHFMILLPLFITRWRLSDVNSYFFSLIYYQRKKGEDYKRWLLPIFYQMHNHHKQLILSPIYYWWKKDSNSLRLILPFFIDVVKGETHIIVFTFPTFIYYRKSIFKFTSFFPFFFRTQDATKNEIFTYYFPIFGRWSQGTSDSSHYFFFPLFRYKRSIEKESRSLDILFPLIHYDRSPSSHSFRFLPLFWKSSNENNEFLLIMPLFWRFVTDKTTRAQSNTLFLPFYFKRDSAQYLLTFATPALLPPYYIHYHREDSQVERTYVFPFYAHRIKGLDHLQWFLLILYRKSWRDFSDNMYMNILLYFKYRSDKYDISGLVPFFVQWLEKPLLPKDGVTSSPSGAGIIGDGESPLQRQYVINPDSTVVSTTTSSEIDLAGTKYHLRILLLLAYDKCVDKAKVYGRVAIFWLVSNRVSLFTHKWTHQTTVNVELQVQRNASKIDVFDTQLPSKEIELESKNQRQSIPEIKIIKTHKVFLWPLFHAKSKDSNIDGNIYRHFGLFWIAKPFISLFYRQRSMSESLTFFFLLFYIKLGALCRQIAFFWLFNPNVSLFLREVTVFATITRFIPLFWYFQGKESSAHNEDTTEDVRKERQTQTILSIIYLVPRYGLYNYNNNEIKDKCTHYFLPLYYHSRSMMKSRTAVIWFAHPIVSLFYYNSNKDNYTYHRIVPIYYRETDTNPAESLSRFSLLWIGHPMVALFRYYKDTTESIVSLFPLFWKKSSNSQNRHFQKSVKFHLSIIYLVPRFGFIDYSTEETEPDYTYFRFYIMLLFFIDKEDGTTTVSLFYAVHPMASLLRGVFTKERSKMFMVPFIYYLRDDTRMVNHLSLLWIANPRIAFIAYWRNGLYSHFHIPLLLWVSSAEDYYQWGVCWIAFGRTNTSSNGFINQSVPHQVEPISAIYYPVSLFLYYNDGAYCSHHFMPFYRYVWWSSKESEKLWALLGMFYLSTRQDITEFRFFYRWIRVKSSESVSIVEVNPFVAYRRKGSNSRVLILGGMIGHRDEGGGGLCNVCCIEC